MKRIVKLTENDLTKIVKKVIFETTMSKEQVKKDVELIIDSCIKNIKRLKNIMTATGYTAVAIFLGVLTLFTIEVPGFAIMFGTSTVNFGYKAYEHLKGIYKSFKKPEEKKQFETECKSFYSCALKQFEQKSIIDFLNI
jgi:hypothetical protein